MKAIDALATLACCFIGCGGRVGGAGSQAQPPGDGAIAALDGGVPGGGPSDAQAAGDEAPPTPALTQGPTVWVGQSDRNVTLPLGYDGGTVIDGNANPWAPEKVVLILDAKTNPVIGTITFGDVGPPPPAVDPNQPYPPGPTMVQGPNGQTALLFGASNQSPFPGFSYSLVSSTLSGNLLDLTFVPSELWRGWCALQDPSVDAGSSVSSLRSAGCVCDGGACTSDSSPVRRVTLTVSGDAMQGQLLYPVQVAVAPILKGSAAIRLQRVQ